MSNLARAIFAAAAIGLAQIGEVHATPVTYTFSGEGAGTVNGSAFSGAFSFVLNAATTAIDTSGAPFFRLNNISGTFTEGSYSATLTSTVTIVATASALFPRINFFNATFDNGLGLQDPSLATYDLSTSFGPLTVTDPANLTPTFNALGDGFTTTGGDTVELTADRSLTFTASVESVPEPASLALIGTGLLGLALIRRRRKTSRCASARAAYLPVQLLELQRVSVIADLAEKAGVEIWGADVHRLARIGQDKFVDGLLAAIEMEQERVGALAPKSGEGETVH